MHRSLPRPAAVLAALALLAASTHLSAQKALVLCPPADASGCGRVAHVLAGMEGAGGGSLFPGGVDRRFEDLRAATPAEMHAYSLVFVPSFAGAPYDLLREAPVRERLRGILTGRVAVWSGTPDRGTTAEASAGKLELIGNLARWAAAGGSAGLVVLQDFSGPRADGTSKRYDWIRGVAGIGVSAAPEVRTFRGVRTAEGGEARGIVGDLAYENMASFGLAATADPGTIRAFGREGPGKPAAEDVVVLVGWDRGPATAVAAQSLSSPVIDIATTKISLTSTTTFQVRIFASATFDAVAIDSSTVRFVVDGILPGAPVATQVTTGALMTAVTDLNGDGRKDRIVQFRVTQAKAAGLSGPNHQFDVRGQAASGAFQSSDPTPPPVVDYLPVATVTIVPGSAGIAVGGTVDLDVVLRAADSSTVSGHLVSWTSFDSTATVDANGVTTGQSPGLTRIVPVSEGKADTAEVTVTGEGGSYDAPTAANDAYATDEDTPLNVAAPGVLANDTDPEGSPLTAVLVSGPAHATLTLNADGSFTYTPIAGTLRVKLQNNTVAAPLSGVRPGIRIDSGSALGNTTVCLEASGNTSAGSGGTAGIGVRKQGNNPAVNVFRITGIGTPTPTNAQVVAYLNAQNPVGGGTLVLAGNGYGSCSLP